MDHFTSPAPRGRDETQTRSLTRRSFLGEIAAGAAAFNAMALPTPSLARDNPPFPKPASAMDGAEYIALLGGTDRTPIDGNIKKRWLELAAGPLIDAIDRRALIICPRCLFASYAFVPCQICLQWAMVEPDHVTNYLASLRENYEDLPEAIEEFLTEQRIERAVDLFDGPESAEYWGETLYIREMLRA